MTQDQALELIKQFAIDTKKLSNSLLYTQHRTQEDFDTFLRSREIAWTHVRTRIQSECLGEESAST